MAKMVLLCIAVDIRMALAVQHKMTEKTAQI